MSIYAAALLYPTSMEPLSEGPASQRSVSAKRYTENEGGDESEELSMSRSDISMQRENLWDQSLEEEETQVSNRDTLTGRTPCKMVVF